jgi:large subunit ribosomal protein L21
MTEKTLKKAVILTGGKQYLVQTGEELNVELLDPTIKPDFDALLVIDGDKTSVGAPLVEGIKVSADIVEQVIKSDKVTAIRYKPKKRVRKVRGHRQKLTRIKITKIAEKTAKYYIPADKPAGFLFFIHSDISMFHK